tara:strand:- start:17 stop:337 length:321 start_codon:yes stop_codon:yes gene_type:complete
MTYLFLYLIGLILIWYIYKVGWLIALKTAISVIIPSFLIILFNIKAGRLLYKSPILGIISALPTSIFIYRGSKPIVFLVNNWIDSKANYVEIQKDIIDTESVSIDE